MMGIFKDLVEEVVWGNFFFTKIYQYGRYKNAHKVAIRRGYWQNGNRVGGAEKEGVRKSGRQW